MNLFDASTLLAYLAAATVLVLVPGPGTAWIVAQAAVGGTGRGLRAGLGLETATLLHAAGAAYLVWLGLRTWRARPDGAVGPAPRGDARPVFLRSVLTGLLNPKVALFFLAFLPQFVRPERGRVWLQFLLLGLLLSMIGFAHSALLSVAVGRLGRRVRLSASRWKERVLGAFFLGLGVRLALQQRG